MKFSTKDTGGPSFRIKFKIFMQKLRERFVREAPISPDDDFMDEEEPSFFLNAQGKMVYLNDDGEEVELTPEQLELLQLNQSAEDQAEAAAGDENEENGDENGDEGSDAGGADVEDDVDVVGSPGAIGADEIASLGADDHQIDAARRKEEARRRRKDRRRKKMAQIKADEEAAAAAALDDGVNLGEGGGFLERRAKELAQAKEERLQARLAKKQAEEEGVEDWWEWNCVICKKDNRRPRELRPNFDTIFIVKGVYFKRTVVSLKPSSTVPTCENCYTPADYKPRLCNKHFIKDVENPREAFSNYPISTPHIPRHWSVRVINGVVSFFVGRRNHPDSKLMPNDWRMQLYLSSKFPEIKRPKKKPEDLYIVGEIVECRLQKKEWCRARITLSRHTRAYDIM